jgi:UDP-N-acetylglucosamine transferase subunit ALG13
MIFVTVGTNEARFDRLLEAVAGLRTDETLVVQHGHSSPFESPNSELVDFLSFEQLVERMRGARVIVTHAGVGSIMVALANAKRPVVVPRRASFGEAVDDHQLQLGRRLAAANLVTLVESPDELGDALERPDQELTTNIARSSALAKDLRSFFEDVLRSSRTSVDEPARA